MAAGEAAHVVGVFERVDADGAGVARGGEGGEGEGWVDLVGFRVGVVVVVGVGVGGVMGGGGYRVGWVLRSVGVGGAGVVGRGFFGLRVGRCG